MYMLKTSASFDSAHFLSGYNGKCANIHGHRWTIEVTINGNSLQTEGEKRGMIIDFSDLKKAVRSLADDFDHALIYEQGTLKPETENALADEGFRTIKFPFRPTAEELAKYFFNQLKNKGFPVYIVTVFETPDNSASYQETEEKP